MNFARMVRRWPVLRAQLQQTWHHQIRLHQLYLDRHDVSGGDALDALAGRRLPQTRVWRNG